MRRQPSCRNRSRSQSAPSRRGAGLVMRPASHRILRAGSELPVNHVILRLAMSYHHLVALGSSFAAGPGIEPVADAGAMRAARNYPHLLAERLGAELTDLTVSGATTGTILSKAQRTLRGARF